MDWQSEAAALEQAAAARAKEVQPFSAHSSELLFAACADRHAACMHGDVATTCPWCTNQGCQAGPLALCNTDWDGCRVHIRCLSWEEPEQACGCAGG